MDDKVSLYWSATSGGLLVAISLGAVMAFVATPRRFRLALALILLANWLTLGLMTDLGAIQIAAKITAIVPYILVAVAAALHPGQRMKLPQLIWLYPVVAVAGFIYVLPVFDLPHALITRLQWLAAVVAALLVARTLTNHAAFSYLSTSLTVALAIALLIPLSDLIINPSDSFIRGLGRFAPYGANPNQIGVAFSLAATLSAFSVMQTRSFLLRGILATVVAAAVGMALLTASRSVVYVTVLPMMAISLRFVRRPIYMILVLIIALPIVLYIIRISEEAEFSRLLSFETTRVDQFFKYIDIIKERPIFGLMFSDGAYSRPELSLGYHPHNAYLELLYLGGISYALPMLFLLVTSIVCAVRNWVAVRRFPLEAPFVRLSIIVLLLMYAHGFINGAIYYPTPLWGFVHVVFAAFNIAFWRSISASSLHHPHSRPDRVAPSTLVLWTVAVLVSVALLQPSSFASARLEDERPSDPFFLVFDATLYNEKPDLKPYGIHPMKVLYQYELLKRDHRNKAWILDPGKVAQAVANIPQGPVLLDVETWDTNPRHLEEPQLSENLGKLQLLTDIVRTVRPDLRIGYFRLLPTKDYRVVVRQDPEELAQWAAGNLRKRYSVVEGLRDPEGLADAVDFVVPCLYYVSDNPAVWGRYARSVLAEARNFDKQVYAILMPEEQSTAHTEVSRDFWRIQLETCLQETSCDGVIIWGGANKTWDPDAEWWQATQEFLATLRARRQAVFMGAQPNAD
jgi:hypothetical protein